MMELEGELHVNYRKGNGYYISNDHSTYLLVDGTINQGSTRTAGGVYSYWETEKEAQEFLDSWEII